jgi:hypothetical protein
MGRKCHEVNQNKNKQMYIWYTIQQSAVSIRNEGRQYIVLSTQQDIVTYSNCF